MRLARFVKYALLGCCMLFAMGCAFTDTPALGLIWTNATGPVTATGIIGNKKGEASCTSVLGLFAHGDCSIAAAARNGGIIRVSSVDYRAKRFFSS